MVIIYKTGKDATTAKGYRPIVLANTVGKLADKSVADLLQEHIHLFQEGQYGFRKNRSAIDALMCITSLATRALLKRPSTDPQKGHRLGLQQPAERTTY